MMRVWRLYSVLAVAAALLVGLSGVASASSSAASPLAVARRVTIHVPTNAPTIQAAIDAASDGDIVVVAPGSYVGDIDFLGKAITVRSAKGPKKTTIVGQADGPAVSFHTNEGASSVLKGFTVTGGAASFGGGIYVFSASPMIQNDVVSADQACYGGAGVYLDGGAAVLSGDTVSGNAQEARCTSGNGGGGIEVTDTVGAQITHTTVENNAWTGSGPGGVSFFQPGTVTMLDSTIEGNSPGGITLFNDNTATVVQNLITGNPGGPGILVSAPGKSEGPIFTNNTVVAGKNQGALGVTGVDSGVELYNNIFVSGAATQPAVTCSTASSPTPPHFVTDLAWSGGGQAVLGSCVSSFLNHGNLTANPEFANPSINDYQLMPGSPAINAGTNGAPAVPSTDFLGNPRIVGGVIDLGVYESL